MRSFLGCVEWNSAAGTVPERGELGRSLPSGCQIQMPEKDAQLATGNTLHGWMRGLGHRPALLQRANRERVAQVVDARPLGTTPMINNSTSETLAAFMGARYRLWVEPASFAGSGKNVSGSILPDHDRGCACFVAPIKGDWVCQRP
jgi:hypothetical protein